MKSWFDAWTLYTVHSHLCGSWYCSEVFSIFCGNFQFMVLIPCCICICQLSDICFLLFLFTVSNFRKLVHLLNLWYNFIVQDFVIKGSTLFRDLTSHKIDETCGRLTSIVSCLLNYILVTSFCFSKIASYAFFSHDIIFDAFPPSQLKEDLLPGLDYMEHLSDRMGNKWILDPLRIK